MKQRGLYHLQHSRKQYQPMTDSHVYPPTNLQEKNIPLKKSRRWTERFCYHGALCILAFSFSGVVMGVADAASGGATAQASALPAPSATASPSSSQSLSKSSSKRAAITAHRHQPSPAEKTWPAEPGPVILPQKKSATRSAPKTETNTPTNTAPANTAPTNTAPAKKVAAKANQQQLAQVMSETLLAAKQKTSPYDMSTHHLMAVASNTASNTSANLTATHSTQEKTGVKTETKTGTKQAASTSSTATAPQKQIWNLQDVDIRAVIDTVSKVTGKNFIIDPRVQGKMTIVSAKPMDAKQFYQAFLSMLQVLNYTAIPSGSIIKIVPSMDARSMGAPFVTAQQAKQVAADQIVVRMVPIVHTSASELVNVLRPLMPESSTITAYAPSNALILAGSSGNIDKLVDMIDSLDRDHSSRVAFIPLKHSSATQVVTMLQSLQSNDRSQGKVSNISYAADANSNTILISGTPQNIEQSEALIKRLDSEKSAVTATVIHLNYLDATKFAPTLSKLATASLGSTAGAAKIAIVAQKEQNALLVEAPAAVLQQVDHLIAKLDHRPGQVLIQAVIARVDNKLLGKLGVMWGQISPAEELAAATGAGSAGFNPEADSGKVGMIFGSNFVPKVSGFGALVNALNSNSNSSILSTPSVMVMNNEKATISNGQTIRQTDQSSLANPGDNGASGGLGSYFPTATYTDKKVDLSLDVTPQISPNHTLQLVISQKNDSLDADAAVASSGNAPINTQSLKTHVMVCSGQILVLGGLVQNTHSNGEKKIPFLGDIPVLGHLFRYKDKSDEKSSLMIFIRSTVIDNDEQSLAATEKRYRYMREQQIQSATNSMRPNELLPRLHGKQSSARVHLPNPFAEGSGGGI